MAALTWKCPSCDYTRDEEGTCPDHIVSLGPVLPAASPPPARISLISPWGQRIEIPPEGLEISRSSDFAAAHPRIREYTQVSRPHVRLAFDDDGGLVATDLDSLNHTYVFDVELPPQQPYPIQPPARLRLGQPDPDLDATFEVVAVNEFGEPL